MLDLNIAKSNVREISRERPRVRSRHLSKRATDAIFIIVMLAYPVLQFLITWIFVNFGAISMAFNGSEFYDDFQFSFVNFKKIFDDLAKPYSDQSGFLGLNSATIVLLNSLGYCFITIFISLPLSLLFSYFLRKKMPIANVFRAIFFLPNIIPIVALTFAFRMSYTYPVGYLSKMFEAMGINTAKLTKGTTYTWTVAGEVNAKYRIQITNAYNAQFQTIKLKYE